jgi:hypothetical protein
MDPSSSPTDDPVPPPRGKKSRSVRTLVNLHTSEADRWFGPGSDAGDPG